MAATFITKLRSRSRGALVRPAMSVRAGRRGVSTALAVFGATQPLTGEHGAACRPLPAESFL